MSGKDMPSVSYHNLKEASPPPHTVFSESLAFNKGNRFLNCRPSNSISRAFTYICFRLCYSCCSSPPPHTQCINKGAIDP